MSKEIEALKKDFETWYFGIKSDLGKPPLALQIWHWIENNVVYKSLPAQDDKLAELKRLTVENLLNVASIDEPYLVVGRESYTRRELAAEIQNNTKRGLDTLNNLLQLTIDLLQRGKLKSLPAQDDNLIWSALLSGIRMYEKELDFNKRVGILNELRTYYKISKVAATPAQDDNQDGWNLTDKELTEEGMKSTSAFKDDKQDELSKVASELKSKNL